VKTWRDTINNKTDRQFMYNVTLSSVRATIIVVEKY